jgi:hypothetical protein
MMYSPQEQSLASHLSGQHNAYKLSYTQAIFLAQRGENRLPNSPRERNLLNLVALLPKVQPLTSSRALLDSSQSCEFLSLGCNGAAQTAACNTKYWWFAGAYELPVADMLVLMGHSPAELHAIRIIFSSLSRFFHFVR